MRGGGRWRTGGGRPSPPPSSAWWIPRKKAESTRSACRVPVGFRISERRCERSCTAPAPGLENSRISLESSGSCPDLRGPQRADRGLQMLRSCLQQMRVGDRTCGAAPARGMRRWREVEMVEGGGDRCASHHPKGAGTRTERSGRRGVGRVGRRRRGGQSSESRRRSQRSDWRSMKEERFFAPLPPLAGLSRPASD